MKIEPLTAVRIKDPLARITWLAGFEPVRTIGDCTIGWATVDALGASLRFPAIIYRPTGNVVTVQDWQASRGDYAEDLGDPDQVADMLGLGVGVFLTSCGRASSLGLRFAR